MSFRKVYVAIATVLFAATSVCLCPQSARAQDTNAGLLEGAVQEAQIGEAASIDFSGVDNESASSVAEGEASLELYATVNDTIKITGTADYAKAKEQLELTNAERVKAGKSPLIMNKYLQEAAMQRAAECAFNFDHTRPDGTKCYTAFPNSGYARGENIAAGYSTAEATTNQWMNSPGHKANILDDDYKAAGIGCFKVGALYYWVQCFGTLTDEGYVSTTAATKTFTVSISYSTVPFANGKSAFNRNMAQSDPEPLACTESYELQVGINNAGWSRVYAPTEARSFTWSSSDASIASVNADGLVKAGGKAGKATIKATSPGGYSWTKTFSVSHKLVAHAKVSATCFAAGNNAYWTCSDCGAVFADANGTKITTVAAQAIKKLSHNMTHHAAVAATNSAAGNIEYWTCSQACCKGMYFTKKDGSATTKSVAIAKLGTISWTRLWGDSRYDTMKAISSAGWSSASTVIVASAANFPDALAASSLAGAKSCPILLTDPGSLSSQTSSQIKSLGATKVYIVGGSAAISANVESQIKRLGCTTQRLAGSTRQDTALKVASELGSAHGDTCIIATGKSFADALSISPYAYAKRSPIYLTEGDGTLSSTTLNAIKQAGFSRAVIVGGTGVVSTKAESQLKQIGLSSQTRLGGAQRYETSSKIAKWCLSQGMSVANVGVASGDNFPDAPQGMVASASFIFAS